MLKNVKAATRLGFGFGILAILMALTVGANSATTSDGQAVQRASTSQVSAGYLENMGGVISSYASAEFN